MADGRSSALANRNWKAPANLLNGAAKHGVRSSYHHPVQAVPQRRGAARRRVARLGPLVGEGAGRAAGARGRRLCGAVGDDHPRAALGRCAQDLRAAAAHERARERRDAGAILCARAPGRTELRRISAAAGARVPGGRGQDVLRASRRRLSGPRRRDHRLRAQVRHGRARQGRIDDHATGRQEPADRQRLFADAQDQGGDPRLSDRGYAYQAADPGIVSQPDRAGPQRVRGRGGEPRLFRQGARRADAAAARVSGDPAQGAVELRPGAPSRPRAGAAQLRAGRDAEERLHQSAPA